MFSTIWHLISNPRGWTTVRTISNDLTGEGGWTRLGTLTFILQRDRRGNRRYLIKNPDKIHENAIKHSVGLSHGELWVKRGELPI